MVDGLLGHACMVAVMSSSADNQPYILGDTFMRNFYVSFDYKHTNVLMAISVNAPEGVKVTEKIPDWAIITIVAVCLLVAIVLLCVLCKYCRKKKS